MRLFAAIIPPSSAIEHLTAALQPVHDDFLRWSEPAALHVTLAFYGEVPDALVPELIERLTRAAKRHSPMKLQLHGAGRFSGTVLWVGVQGDTEILRRLAWSAIAAGQRMDLPKMSSRRFRPHITVARSSKPTNLRPYVTALTSYDGPPWRAAKLALVRSHLRAEPGGRARYETIERFPLRARAG